MKGHRVSTTSKSEQGFTIIELMIATLVFSTILLLVTFGILQISRTYYKGVTSARTQNTARAVMDRIAQAIQFSGTNILPTDPGAVASGANYKFCIDDKRFSYLLGRQLTDGPPSASQARHVLVVDTEPSCATSSPQDLIISDSDPEPCATPHPNKLTCTSVELLSPNMRLSHLSVQHLSSELYQITIRVVYGDDDLLSDKLAADGTPGTDGILDTCETETGSQFCAVSELSTTVQKRVN